MVENRVLLLPEGLRTETFGQSEERAGNAVQPQRSNSLNNRTMKTCPSTQPAVTLKYAMMRRTEDGSDKWVVCGFQDVPTADSVPIQQDGTEGLKDLSGKYIVERLSVVDNYDLATRTAEFLKVSVALLGLKQLGGGHRSKVLYDEENTNAPSLFQLWNEHLDASLTSTRWPKEENFFEAFDLLNRRLSLEGHAMMREMFRSRYEACRNGVRNFPSLIDEVWRELGPVVTKILKNLVRSQDWRERVEESRFEIDGFCSEIESELVLYFIGNSQTFLDKRTEHKTFEGLIVKAIEGRLSSELKGLRKKKEDGPLRRRQLEYEHLSNLRERFPTINLDGIEHTLRTNSTSIQGDCALNSAVEKFYLSKEAYASSNISSALRIASTSSSNKNGGLIDTKNATVMALMRAVDMMTDRWLRSESPLKLTHFLKKTVAEQLSQAGSTIHCSNPWDQKCYIALLKLLETSGPTGVVQAKLSGFRGDDESGTFEMGSHELNWDMQQVRLWKYQNQINTNLEHRMALAKLTDDERKAILDRYADLESASSRMNSLGKKAFNKLKLLSEARQ